MNEGYIRAISISERKGVKKENVREAEAVQQWGLRGDAHGGFMHQQISLLAIEDIEEMRAKGFDVKPGDFAENITTSGLVLWKLPVGTMLKIGETELKVSQIGKECHMGCAIRELTGDCIMPRRGIFATVEKGGMLHTGDFIVVIGE